VAGFGFTPPNSSDDDKDENKAFDPKNFGEIFQQFTGMGLNLESLIGALTGQSSATLSRELIRDLSRKFLTAHGEMPLTLTDVAESFEALTLADLWLNEVTIFPAQPIGESSALTRREWIDSTLAGWQELAEPLALGISEAMTIMLEENLGGENQGVAGFELPTSAISTMMSALMTSMMSTQLGQTIGTLSTTVTGANDVALPLMANHRPFLIPENVRAWGKGLEIPETEVRIFLALREVAAARLFVATPWLRDYIRESIALYGRGIRVDMNAMTEQAEEAISSGDFDLNNPESMSKALAGGMFTPEETPTQKGALERLETLLALIEGWIDATVHDAAHERIPSFIRLREAQQRVRATKSPTQLLFATLIGLEVSPRRTREAINFWEQILKIGDLATRDQIWDEALLLPSSEQLTEPESYLKSRTVPDDLSGLL
jgi:putative hydrolase